MDLKNEKEVPVRTLKDFNERLTSFLYGAQFSCKIWKARRTAELSHKFEGYSYVMCCILRIDRNLFKDDYYKYKDLGKIRVKQFGLFTITKLIGKMR